MSRAATPSRLLVERPLVEPTIRVQTEVERTMNAWLVAAWAILAIGLPVYTGAELVGAHSVPLHLRLKLFGCAVLITIAGSMMFWAKPIAAVLFSGS